eukprot:g64145.t1
MWLQQAKNCFLQCNLALQASGNSPSTAALGGMLFLEQGSRNLRTRSLARLSAAWIQVEDVTVRFRIALPSSRKHSRFQKTPCCQQEKTSSWFAAFLAGGMSERTPSGERSFSQHFQTSPVFEATAKSLFHEKCSFRRIIFYDSNIYKRIYKALYDRSRADLLDNFQFNEELTPAQRANLGGPRSRLRDQGEHA